MLRFRLLAAPTLAAVLTLSSGFPALAQSQGVSTQATPPQDAPSSSPFALDPLTVRGLLDRRARSHTRNAGTDPENY
jgi:hypothetical protein